MGVHPGGGAPKEIDGSVLLPVWRHVSSKTCKMASKVLIEEMDKSFEILMDKLFPFLGLAMLRSLPL